MAAAPPAFELAGAEVTTSRTAVPHISRYLPLVRACRAPFLLVLCFMLPFKGVIIHFAIALAAPAPPPAADAPDLPPHERVLARCACTSGQHRNVSACRGHACGTAAVHLCTTML